MGKRIEIDSDELRRLHAEGLTDAEIGGKLGCSGGTILSNRRLLGLGVSRKVGKAATAREKLGGEVAEKVTQGKGAIVRVDPQITPIAEIQTVGLANGHGKASCRVIMIEIQGSKASVLSAIEAVKAALARSA